jgi:hypothetical protein
MRKLLLLLFLTYVKFIMVFKLKPLWPQKEKGGKKERKKKWQISMLSDWTPLENKLQIWAGQFSCFLHIRSLLIITSQDAMNSRTLVWWSGYIAHGLGPHAALWSSHPWEQSWLHNVRVLVDGGLMWTEGHRKKHFGCHSLSFVRR